MEDAIPLTSTLWILVSAALVLFMVPGLALFYGGMSRSKNMLNMLMMNMVCLGLVPVVWVLVGYSLSSTGTNQWIGTFDNAFLQDVPLISEDGTGSPLLAVFFALTFASITPGAQSDRFGTEPAADRARSGRSRVVVLCRGRGGRPQALVFGRRPAVDAD